LAVKLLSYATLLFFGMMVFLMIKEPYTINVVDSNGNLIPAIELFNAQNYQIKENNIESVVHAERVERYDDFDKLYVINADHKTKEGLIGKLTSDEGMLQNKIMHFKTNSHYYRNDGVSLDGEDIFYDMQKEILSSEKPFIFAQQQSRSHGLSFVYQMKEGTISAINIHSFIQEQERKKKKR